MLQSKEEKHVIKVGENEYYVLLHAKPCEKKNEYYLSIFHKASFNTVYKNDLLAHMNLKDMDNLRELLNKAEILMQKFIYETESGVL